jgi:ABC-type transporter Mla subunit MlaD
MPLEPSDQNTRLITEALNQNTRLITEALNQNARLITEALNQNARLITETLQSLCVTSANLAKVTGRVRSTRTLSP